MKDEGGQRAAGMGEAEGDWDATPCVAAPNGSEGLGEKHFRWNQWGTEKGGQRAAGIG